VALLTTISLPGRNGVLRNLVCTRLSVRKSRVRLWRRLVDSEAERGNDALDHVKDGLLPLE
jgi:hypothetical protein